MDVGTTTWQLVGDTTPNVLHVQNVGTVRIAYVLAAAGPGPTDIVLDTDEHFILRPGDPKVTFDALNTEGVSMYARALGSKNGSLAVSSYNV